MPGAGSFGAQCTAAAAGPLANGRFKLAAPSASSVGAPVNASECVTVSVCATGRLHERHCIINRCGLPGGCYAYQPMPAPNGCHLSAVPKQEQIPLAKGVEFPLDQGQRIAGCWTLAGDGDSDGPKR